MEDASTRDPRGPLPHERTHSRLFHQHLRKPGDVSRGRHVARRIEPVRTGVVRVRQAESSRVRVHRTDEGRLVPVADVVGERVGCVVRTLDQRAREEVANRDALTRPQMDRRFTDLRRFPLHRHDIVELCTLERDQDGHELRDARDRQASIGRMLRQDVAGRAVDDDVRTCVHARGPGLGGSREGQSCDRNDNQPPHGLQPSPHVSAAPHAAPSGRRPDSAG